MTALEKLGLEVAATNWLRIRSGGGRLLAAFLLAPPASVLSAEVLDERMRPAVGAWADLRIHDVGSDEGRGRVRVTVHRLKNALADVGFPGCIENLAREGYRLKPEVRDAIRAEIEASL